MKTVLSMLLLAGVFVQFSSSAVASEAPSAVRYKNESYAEAYLRNVPSEVYRSYAVSSSASAEDSAVELSKTDINKITTVWSATGFQANFAGIRDKRYLTTSNKPKFMRRISWLYPDNGCWVRAALANQLAEKANLTRPNKVFIFGDLTVKTANSPSGEVSWWYHVAPLVKVMENGVYKSYVLDPAIEPAHPILLEDWVGKMTADKTSVRLAFCNTYAFGPFDVCDAGVASLESSAQNDIKSFLSSEWDRLVELNRSPEQELGDLPPWMN